MIETLYRASVKSLKLSLSYTLSFEMVQWVRYKTTVFFGHMSNNFEPRTSNFGTRPTKVGVRRVRRLFFDE